MDPKKIGVDESQISKTTGRIILPEEEVQRFSQRSQAPRPRLAQQVPPVQQPAQGFQAQHVAQVASEVSEPSLPVVAPRASVTSPFHLIIIAVLSFLVVLQTIWLLWSHSQTHTSIRQMHDQVIKLSSDLTSQAETIKSLNREILEIKVLLARSAEEQKNQARAMAEIRSHLQAMDIEPASTTAPVMQR
ncbi:MAG: hypothetical protein N2035_01580 [Chthoniobacterales bacterium]|nr:hypothetical protein [Chthoniobacterales bacterium]MCX7712348.1 hypothetical protein [Chthoniobacterales bacterium]